MTWSHAICNTDLYLSPAPIMSVDASAPWWWPHLASPPCPISISETQHKVLKPNTKFPVSLCSIISSHRVLGEMKTLIYLNVWVDGFYLTDTQHEISLQPITVQVNDGTAIELKSSLAKKLWVTFSCEARTKSNVNGSWLILRTSPKSRMTKPVSFTIPENVS